MGLDVVEIPYDSGHRDRRMGAGPGHLMRHGLVDALRAIDPDVSACRLETADGFVTEIGSAFELHRAAAARVSRAVRSGAMPLVLSGNCNSAIGTLAGLQAALPGERIGVVWFDGHGDCNTPGTFTGDFLDAMGLGTLTGRCWQALAGTVPGFRPLLDRNVILVGGHGMDDGARSVLAASDIAIVSPADIRTSGASAALAPRLDVLRQRGVTRVYLHLDVDVVDAAYAPANGFAPKGGLLPDEICAVLGRVLDDFDPAAACVASYDPAFDRDDRIRDIALRFLAQAASRRTADAARGAAGAAPLAIRPADAP